MKAIVIGACAILVSALPAAAQICKGQIAVIRVSTIKAGGTRSGFDKAVADQIAWYRGHNLTANKIVEADVIDISGGKPTVSSKEVMTVHYDPPAARGAQPATDDSYKAFVKEFRDNSDIAVEKTVCLPK